jgi:hypothetical protein
MTDRKGRLASEGLHGPRRNISRGSGHTDEGVFFRWTIPPLQKVKNMQTPLHSALNLSIIKVLLALTDLEC